MFHDKLSRLNNNKLKMLTFILKVAILGNNRTLSKVNVNYSLF